MAIYCRSFDLMAFGSDLKIPVARPALEGGVAAKSKKGLAMVARPLKFYGGLGRIRTPDPLIRSQVLYPTELPIRVSGDLAMLRWRCKGEI